MRRSRGFLIGLCLQADAAGQRSQLAAAALEHKSELSLLKGVAAATEADRSDLVPHAHCCISLCKCFNSPVQRPQVQALKAAKAAAEAREAVTSAAAEQAAAAAADIERANQARALGAAEQAVLALQERLNTQLLRNATAAKVLSA